ncbi:MAG: DEAD/DEAH box helicase [Alicyclobacillus sp.]|nr:DEAD/DEAH box helicase [Alicyclobacillus sp.]
MTKREVKRAVWLQGRWLPEQGWADAGCGELWLEREHGRRLPRAEAEAQWRDWPLVQPALAAGTARCGPRGELRADSAVWLAWLCQLPAAAPWPMAPALSLYVRALRLAQVLVGVQDVLPFAAPVAWTWAEVLARCGELARPEADSRGWSGATGLFLAAWAPAWTQEPLRAVRACYAAQADVWWPAAGRATSAGRSGRSLLERWLWYCTDHWQRPLLVPAGESGAAVTALRTRLPYRGEQELLAEWRDHLRSCSPSPWSGDGWLIWRTLHQLYIESGWALPDLRDEAGATRYHLALQLQPPEPAHPLGDWQLVVYVAHNVWPEVRAPLAAWWRQPQRIWWIGGERLVRPDTWFLPRLYAAAAEVPELAAMLRQPAPGSLRLPAAQVTRFLVVSAAALARQGVQLIHPALAEVPTHTIAVEVQVAAATASPPADGAALRQLPWAVDWSVVVADQRWSRQEFVQRVAATGGLVCLHGQWRQLPLAAICTRLRALAGGRWAEEVVAAVGAGKERLELPGPGVIDFWSLIRMAQTLSADAAADEVGVRLSFAPTAAPLQAWWQALQAAAQPARLPVPPGFAGRLRAYQERGLAWFWQLRQLGCGGVLADDMGLGKTVQVLAYLQHLQANSASRGVHLIVCPTSLLMHWRQELARFTPGLRVHVHHGPDRLQRLADGRTRLQAARQDAQVLLTTYATAARDAEVLAEQAWDVVLLDEAQHVKNPYTRQWRALHRLPAVQRLALTGTPVENHLAELWSILHWVNPGYAGGAAWFRRTFAQPLQQAGDERTLHRLHRLLRPVVLRRTKAEEEVRSALPEKWEVIRYAALTAEQAALYQAVLAALFNRSTSQSTRSRRGQVLAALVRLKQVCNHPCLLVGGQPGPERSGKLKLLLDCLAAVVAEGEGALVFTQFRTMGEVLVTAVQQQFGWEPAFLHGGLNARQRGELVERYQSGADPSPVMVLSLRAGGVGLNLTRASHVFHYDRWWNPAVEDQATDRVHRLGQVRPVQVHKLICPGTLEERIDHVLTAKRELAARVVGPPEQWLADLNDDDLRALFALDWDVALAGEEG